MDDTKNSPAVGESLGANRIVKRYDNGLFTLGGAFESEFGKTRKRHTLNIAPVGGGDGGVAESETPLKSFFERVRELRHPCLVQYYAHGIDGGFEWVRSEPQTGVPESATTSADLIVEQSQDLEGDVDDPEPLDFPTLESMLIATEGAISPRDACVVARDVSEAIDFLSEEGIDAGPLAPAAIMLDKPHRKNELIARLRYHALDAAVPDEARIARTAGEFGALLRTLAAALDGSRAEKTAAALNGFAAKLEAAAASGVPVSFHSEFLTLLESIGMPCNRRFIPLEDDYADDEGADASAAPEEAPRKRRAAPDFRKMQAPPGSLGQSLLVLFRTLAVIAVVIAGGYGIYLLVKYIGESSKEEYKMFKTGEERYSPVKVVNPDNKTVYSIGGDPLPASVMDYTPGQLEAEAYENPVAAARLLVWQIENEPDKTNLINELAFNIRRNAAKFDKAAETDPVAAYWRGYSLLLGVDDRDGAPRSETNALRAKALDWLERADVRGFTDARILMGDWFAGSRTPTNAENDRAAMMLWIGAFVNQKQTRWMRFHLDAIARINWFVRNNRGVRQEDPQIGEIIISLANAGEPDTMLVAADILRRGFLIERNPNKALEYVRRLSNVNIERNQPAIFAEAQYQWARALEIGPEAGTPKSLTAARSRYERAAKLDHRDAMLRLAALLETGTGADDGKPDPETAKTWREKAAATPPPPSVPLPAKPLSYTHVAPPSANAATPAKVDKTPASATTPRPENSPRTTTTTTRPRTSRTAIEVPEVPMRPMGD